MTLNPWRKLAAETPEETEAPDNPDNPDASTHLLSDSRYDDLARRLDQLLIEEKIFTEPHITVDTLITRLGTNTKYLSEVIHRSGYQSFYDMINTHRVRHAMSLIHQHPDRRLADIAEQCGFSSPASMSKAFKSQGKEPPSSYRG